MTLGAYRGTPQFAYPGWRLTVPGGPAGGHYKGFTHNYAAGTAMDPQDQYEWERASGSSSHDAVHASVRNPRGVYRSSGEVPPRPNASGNAMTYRGFQTKRHAGTSISPGSFPASFEDTEEDSFLHGVFVDGLGLVLRPVANGGPSAPVPYRLPLPGVGVPRPAPIIAYPTSSTPPVITPVPYRLPLPGVNYPTPVVSPIVPAPGAPMVPAYPAPSWGATSVVAQPPPTQIPQPPAPSLPVYVAPPVSPAPAPTVATNQVVPSADGTGYVNLSTGVVIPASQVQQNPATGQLVQTSGFDLTSIETWLTENTLISSLPNWAVVGGGLALLMMLRGSGGRRR